MISGIKTNKLKPEPLSQNLINVTSVLLLSEYSLKSNEAEIMRVNSTDTEKDG